MGRVVWGVVLCAVAVCVAGCGSDAPKPAGTFTLRGSFVLNAHATQETTDSGETCSGYDGGGTGDVVPGAVVTVYDDAGKPVGHGVLGKGVVPDTELSVPCSFPVVIRGVPKGSKWYAVSFAPRGKKTLSAAEAEAGGFSAALD